MKIYFSALWKKSTTTLRNSVVLLVMMSSIIATPLNSQAILFLLLQPLLIGDVIATMIGEAILWCAVGILCHDSGGSQSSNICDANAPDHAAVVPNITLTASFTSTSTAWSSDPSKPAPNDSTIIAWHVTNGDTCTYTTTWDDTVRSINLDGTKTYIPGQHAEPGDAPTYFTVTCNNKQCDINQSKSYSYIIPKPNIGAASSFFVDSNLVRYGTTTKLNWNIKANNIPVYPLSCTIYGAVPGASYNFNTGTAPSGSVVTRIIQNNFVSSLKCTEPISGSVFRADSNIEVIPQLYEI
jgi:hypothetical protein